MRVSRHTGGVGQSEVQECAIIEQMCYNAST